MKCIWTGHHPVGLVVAIVWEQTLVPLSSSWSMSGFGKKLFPGWISLLCLLNEVFHKLCGFTNSWGRYSISRDCISIAILRAFAYLKVKLNFCMASIHLTFCTDRDNHCRGHGQLEAQMIFQMDLLYSKYYCQHSFSITLYCCSVYSITCITCPLDLA